MKFFLLVGLLLQLNDQKFQNQEPIDLVNTFYEWYISERYLQMKPSYKKLENGMTGMDFELYDSLHRKYGFSEQLLEKSKLIYENCRNNLAEIPYEEFIKYLDPGQFENIECDFQFFQWFNSGMENFKYYEVSEVKKVSELLWEITIGFWYHSSKKRISYRTLTLVKTSREWEITDFE